MEKIYSIKDMHCNSCAQIIERALKDKVNKIYVSYAEEEAIIDFDSDKISEKEILDKIHKLGYEAKPLKSVQEIKQMNKIAKDISELKAETKKVESLEEEIEEKEQEIEEEIILIEPYYIETRYSEDILAESFSWEMAEKAYESAKRIKNLVLEKLK